MLKSSEVDAHAQKILENLAAGHRRLAAAHAAILEAHICMMTIPSREERSSLTARAVDSYVAAAMHLGAQRRLWLDDEPGTERFARLEQLDGLSVWVIGLLTEAAGASSRLTSRQRGYLQSAYLELIAIGDPQFNILEALLREQRRSLPRWRFWLRRRIGVGVQEAYRAQRTLDSPLQRELDRRRRIRQHQHRQQQVGSNTRTWVG